MAEQFPKYAFSETLSDEYLARFVRLDNPDSYQFDEFHTHEYNEMLVFFKGGGRHNINFKEHAINDLSIHLLAAGNIHLVERGMKSEGFALVYNDEFLMKIKEMNPTVPYFDFFNQSDIIDLTETDYPDFAFILNELQHSEENRPYTLNMIAAFMTKLTERFFKKEKKVLANREQQIMIQLIALINHNFKAHWSAKHYADALHLSLSTLERKVKSICGKTIIELQQEKLLNEAKRQLHKATHNSKAIADELGFSSDAYFSNWFKKLAGCSPKDFKQKLLATLPVICFLLADCYAQFG